MSLTVNFMLGCASVIIGLFTISCIPGLFISIMDAWQKLAKRLRGRSC